MISGPEAWGNWLKFRSASMNLPKFSRQNCPRQFDYLRDQLKIILSDVDSWYKQDNSYNSSHSQDASNSGNSRANDHQRQTGPDDTRPSISHADSLPVPSSPPQQGPTQGQNPPDLTTLVMAAARVLQDQAAAQQRQR